MLVYCVMDFEGSADNQADLFSAVEGLLSWLINTKEVDYEITLRNEPFKGTEISRRSVAVVALEIAKNPDLYNRENIGINKPGTDGPKPAFM